ncbi:hypothetical protein AB0F72_41830 [Actinoplanes sp. NPDC023936]|uniref:hypothetical protein n=1 Tax=Actinoplanes sp. NPDC023936 TaxID=3154910 RepID=UPI003410D391
MSEMSDAPGPPRQRGRLIINGWLGEVQGLQTSLTKAQEKLASLDRSSSTGSPVTLGMPIITG